MTDPRKKQPAELNDDQLEQVSGGAQPDPDAIPMDEGQDEVQLVVMVHHPANMQ